MNAFAVSFALISAATIAMAAISFRHAGGRREVMAWGWVCVAAAFWGLGGLWATTTRSYAQAYLGWQMANVGSILAPVVYLHFVLEYCRLKQTLLLFSSYFLAAVFLGINFFFKESFFGSLRWVFDEFYYIDWSPASGYIYPIFYALFDWILVLAALFFLLNASTRPRNQVKYLFLASIIAWIGSHGDFLSVFNHSLYPYANFLIAIYPLVAGYAVVRHHLLDINIVVRKSLVYSITVTTATMLYLLVIFVSERFLQGLLGYNSQVVRVGMVIVIGLIFTPLKEAIQRFIDYHFFRGTPFEISEENAALRGELADKEKFKAVAALASGLVHEIRNPLSAIKAFCEFLPEKKDDPAFLSQFARIVPGEIERINSLLTNLLEFSRPTPLQMKEVNIHGLVDEAVDLMRSEASRHNVRIVRNFAPGDIVVTADPNQMKQVFLNLFLNAIQAMAQGGELRVEISIVETGLKPVSTNIQITIADTGHGIAPDDMKHLFQPFFSKKKGGTGLGLAITKDIIERHGGKIRVESAVGQGTRFVVELRQKHVTRHMSQAYKEYPADRHCEIG